LKKGGQDHHFSRIALRQQNIENLPSATTPSYKTYIMANNDNGDILLLVLLLLLLRRYRRQPPTPSNRRWSGQEVVEDLLTCGNSTRIHNQLRMQLDTFNQLQDWLMNNTKLNSS
jgi:hypothetical protein